MIRTGKDYVTAIRSNAPFVYYNGAVVGDITRHPAFANNIGNIADYYDLHFKPDLRATLRVDNPDVGQETEISFLRPQSKEDLRKLRIALGVIHDSSYGYLGRSPDYVNIILTAFASHADDYYGQGTGQQFAENIKKIYYEAATGGLFHSHAVVSPVYDRTTPPNQWPDPFIQVGVVHEDKEGVTVRGAVMITTAGPCADRILYLPSSRADIDQRYAISFSIPTSSEGVKFIARRSFQHGERMGEFEYPLSSRFEESDAFLVFDNVRIAWDNVMFYQRGGEVEKFKAENVDYRTWYNWQYLVRTNSKLKFLAGLAIATTEALNINTNPNTQQKIGEILTYLAINESGLISAEETGQQLPNIYRPNRHFVNTISTFNTTAIPRVHDILMTLSGGSAIPMPAGVKDFENPEERSLLDNYLSTSMLRSIDKSKLLNLVWDVVGSEFSSRSLLLDTVSRGDITQRWAQIYTDIYRDRQREFSGLVRDLLDHTPNPKM